MDFNFVGKTILVVEDEEISRFFFEKALKKTKANLFFVNDGIDAVEMIEKNTEIDLVLMDVQLPRMNGIEAMLKIKALYPELPVIIQTAFGMDTTREQALENGCDEYITKPIKIETLLTFLNRHLLY